MNLKKIILCFFSLLLSDYTNAKSFNKISLCKVDEIDLVSCQINEPKKRIVSICHDKRKNVTEYKFGKKNKIELTQIFTPEKNLLRWTDVATGTVYFGFKNGQAYYSLGVPQKRYGAKTFLEVTSTNQKMLFQKECTENSFGETDKKLSTIKNVPDDKVRNGGFDFPAMFYTK